MRYLLKYLLPAALLLLLVSVQGGEVYALDCSKFVPYGEPTLQSEPARAVKICHRGFLVLNDREAQIPRWVAYTLTGPHTLGCIKREKYHYHADDLLHEDQASDKDYDLPKGPDRKALYQVGHQAPAQDFAWSETQMYDSMSMTNMAPQHQKLNPTQWERLEEIVRAWAWKRGRLLIYVGPQVSATPKRIGAHKVVIPSAFWKVVVDPDTKEALAFWMEQKVIRKGPIEPFQKSISYVEQHAEISLPLPDGIDKSAMPAVWPYTAELKGWKATHKCKK